MPVMARNKPSKPETEPQRPAAKPGRARNNGIVRPVQIEIPVELDDLVERFAQTTHRTKKGVILMALEQLLAREGFGPPE